MGVGIHTPHGISEHTESSDNPFHSGSSRYTGLDTGDRKSMGKIKRWDLIGLVAIKYSFNFAPARTLPGTRLLLARSTKHYG